MTISSTIKPTAKATLPFAIWPNFGRNGAPAAVPNSSRPTPSGSSSCNSLARPRAVSGINTKLASRDSTTSRTLRSGVMISLTVRPKPVPSMLESTKTSTATVVTFCISSISVHLEEPLKLRMDAEATVGEPPRQGWVLVLRFTEDNLRADAEFLRLSPEIPEQTVKDASVASPPEKCIGEARNVFVNGIVDKNTGVIVQVWREVNVSLDPAARGADRLPGHEIGRAHV